MPTFRYDAYNAEGKSLSGVIEAESERQALTRLKESGLFPRSAREENAANSPPLAFGFRRSASAADLALFTRRLATLVTASVPLYEAIGLLYEQERGVRLKRALSRVRDRIAEGASLSRAFETEPDVFRESYVAMVAAGEASGALDVVLDRLADFLEEQEEIRSRVISAFIYPFLMLIVGAVVMAFLFTVVIPKIVVVFEDSKAALPPLTLALIWSSHMLRNWWWVLAGLALVSIPLYRKAMLRDAMRLKRDNLLLKIPFVGEMLKNLLLSRFAKALGLLLSSGVPIIRAIEITSEALVNRAYFVFLKSLIQDIAQGQALSTSLRKSPLFPPPLVHLVGVGEKSGELEMTLLKAGAAYEREFNARLTRCMALLEPFLALAMGCAVGIIVLGVLIPIFEMNQLIK